MYEHGEIEKPERTEGKCAELCGINHGFMPIVVEAVSQEDFDKWVATQTKVQDNYAQIMQNSRSKNYDSR